MVNASRETSSRLERANFFPGTATCPGLLRAFGDPTVRAYLLHAGPAEVADLLRRITTLGGEPAIAMEPAEATAFGKGRRRVLSPD